MNSSPDDEDDDLAIPAMDSETIRLLRYASTLHWDDPAYVLGCFQWNCAQDAYRLGTKDEVEQASVTATRERSDELLEMWRRWMRQYPDLYAKRVARLSESDALPLGTRLTVRLQFLAAELKTIAGEVEYTEAFLTDDHLFARAELEVIRARIHSFLGWTRFREEDINAADATGDPDDPIH